MSMTPFIDPSVRPYDLSPDAFSSEGGSVQNQAAITTYDIYAPNELLMVFERHDHQPGLRLMLKAMGMSRGTFKPTTSHWEYVWRENLISIGSIVTPSGGAGNNMVISIPAGDMYDTGLTSNGTAAKASYPIVGELIYLPDGNVAHIIAKNITTDPHQFTIRPAKATVDLDSSVTAGESYALFTNAHGEGTGLPAGRTPRVVKYLNDFQIIKQVAGVTGSELTNKSYFNPIPGRQGSFYLKTEDDMRWRFEGRCNGALLLGQSTDNVNVFSSEVELDVPVKTTEGMYTHISENGNTSTYTAGSLAFADFDGVSNKFEQERVGTRHICSWIGYLLYNEIENMLQAALNNDMAALLTRDLLHYDDQIMPYDGWQPREAGDFAMNIAFRALKKGRFTYGFKMLHEFSDPQGVGSANYSFPNVSIFTPIGFTKDPVSGGKGCFCGYEFKQLGDVNREVVPAQIVGAGANSTYQVIVSDQFDRRKTAFVSEISYHGSCPNQCVILTT